MQYHIYDIIHLILHMIYYDIKVINYDIIEIYDIIVAQGCRGWILATYYVVGHLRYCRSVTTTS
jgi:hypothetical protein